MSQNGSKPAQGAMLTIQQAQLAVNDVPEFAGNVKAIRTDVLVDKAAEELYPTWEKNPEQWKLVGGDHAVEERDVVARPHAQHVHRVMRAVFRQQAARARAQRGVDIEARHARIFA